MFQDRQFGVPEEMEPTHNLDDDDNNEIEGSVRRENP